jgi:hypothetical protein
MGWWTRFTNKLILAAAKTPDSLVEWLPTMKILSTDYPKGSKEADMQEMMIEAERRLLQFPDDIRIAALQRGSSHKDDFVRGSLCRASARNDWTTAPSSPVVSVKHVKKLIEDGTRSVHKG